MDDEKDLQLQDGVENPMDDDPGKTPDASKPGKTDEEVDAIVEKRLARERAKIRKEIREELEKEQQAKQTEAKKLEDMTELQRAQHEAKMLREENEALELERDLAKQMTIARRELADAGIVLNDDLLSMFVSPEAEKTNVAIDSLKDLFPKAVNAAVEKALKRTPPPAENNSPTTSFAASFAEEYSQNMNGGKK